MSDSPTPSNIGALLRLGAWLEDSLKMEIHSIGRNGLDPEDSITLEVFGKHLYFAIVVADDKLTLLAQELDSPNLPQVLVSLPDNIEGFRTLSRLLRSFERNEVKSLQRPIEVGEAGSAEAWVID
jgi:hypothetical protein